MVAALHGHYLALRWTKYQIRQDAYPKLDRVDWGSVVPRVLAWVEGRKRQGETWDAALDRVAQQSLITWLRKPGKKSPDYPRGWLIHTEHPLERLAKDLDWVGERLPTYHAQPVAAPARIANVEPVDQDKLAQLLADTAAKLRAA